MAKNLYNLKASLDRKTKRKLAQEGTFADAMDMINKRNMALIIRPTGFGKTFTLLDIAKSVKDNTDLCPDNSTRKILFMYPNSIIKQSVFESYFNPGASEPWKMKFIPVESDYKPSKHEYRDYTDIVKTYPDLPIVEFCTYKKFGMDYDNPLRAKALADGKQYKKGSFEKLTQEEKDKVRYLWLNKRLSEYCLIIADEAHQVGATKTLPYWDHIREMCKNNEICAVGATATPLRTDAEVSLDEDIFYYQYGKRRISTRIPDFTINKCWALGLLPIPYYTKAILDESEFHEDIMEIVDKIYEKSNAEEKKRGRKSTKTSNLVVYSNITRGITDKVNRDKEKIDIELAKIRKAHSVLRDAAEVTAYERVTESKYMRFLVFYSNTNDMIEYHDRINEVVRRAFEDTHDTINDRYLLSDGEALESSGMNPEKIIKVEALGLRDKELSESFNSGDKTIDVIHSIKILNMGYHVGDVTGILIKRKTGSEIMFYQQIGRAMSIDSKDRPLIVDFENADSELFKKADSNKARAEAVERIQEFVAGCELSPDCKSMNNMFKVLNKHVEIDKIPDDMLEYFYFDRHMPMYFIYGIAESMQCTETMESLVERIRKIQMKRKDPNIKLTADLYFSQIERLDNRLIGTEERPGLILIQARLVEGGNTRVKKEDD